MVRIHCIALALLMAAGCVTVPVERPRTDLEREIDEAFARAEEPWAGERTGNVTLVVERFLVDRTESSRFESAWRYADERVTARGGSLAHRNGLRIGIELDGFRAALQAALRSASTHRIEKVMITTLNGRPGSIAVGQYTYVEALRVRGPGGGLTLLERAFVGTSLVATPTVLPGDMVRIRLHPRFTARDGQYIDVASLETEVVVANGQSLVIGGTDQASDDVGAALFSTGSRQQERRVLLTVTPHIHGAP